MSEASSEALQDVYIPNPFAPTQSDDEPRTDTSHFHFQCLLAETFSSPEQKLEYSRNAMVQIVRDWLQPRFHHWAKMMNREATARSTNSEVTPPHRALYNVVMVVLSRVRVFTEKLFSIFFTESERATPEGLAFFNEVHLCLLPLTTLAEIHIVLTRTLSFSYILYKRNAENIARFDVSSTMDSEDMATTSTQQQDESTDRESSPLPLDRMIPPFLGKMQRFFAEINDQSSVLRGLSHAPAYAVAQRQIRRIVIDCCYDITCRDMYKKIKKEQERLYQWLRWFSCQDEVEESEESETEEDWETGRKRPKTMKVTVGQNTLVTGGVLLDIDDLIDKEVIEQLTARIYDICIGMFPETTETIEVLRFCLKNQSLQGRDALVNHLIREVRSRLLLVGVPTSSILSAYASSVESLKALDPSCVIMQRVCKAIREYLKKRPDTVREIINFITMEKRNEFHDQQIVSQTRKRGAVVDEEATGLNDEFLPMTEDNPSQANWEEWMPDPPDAPPGESERVRKSADVFNMLVSVYGSKESFVKEYRLLLAERLASAERDVGFERHYLDLLKTRFTDGELQQCEVMLRDTVECERYDKENNLKQLAPLVSARIMSTHFWPAVDRESGVEKFPDVIEENLEEYEQEYQKNKANRRLEFLRGNGMTEMTLTVDDVSVDKLVPNTMAAVLYLFTDKDEWTIDEVMEQLKISKNVAKRRLAWWETQGVLSSFVKEKGTTETYGITKTAQNVERFKTNADDDDEDDMAEDSEAPDIIEQLEQYWKYTLSFIFRSNQEGEVRADRIFQIYRMFASPSSKALTLDHVVTYLGRKVKLGLLTLDNGVYRAVKDPDGAPVKP